MPAVILLLEGTAETLIDRGRAGRARRPPGGARPGWRRSRCSPTGRSACACRRSHGAASAIIPAEDFRRLAFAQPAVHRTVMRRVGPVMSRVTSIEQSRERLASLGTMAAGLAHELNNPAAAAQRTAAQLAEALDVANAAFQHVRRGRPRARAGAAKLIELHDQAVVRARRRAAALDALDAADAEDELREHARAARAPRALAARRAAGRRGRRRGVARASERDRRPGHRRRAPVGGGHAHRPQPGRRAARVHRADVGAGQRGQDVRLHGPRRARRGRPARGPGDHADRARPQAQAHEHPGRSATTTASCRGSRCAAPS